MSKIYTKTGDSGQTSLFNGTRIPKNNIRVEAYGTVDELNSVIGEALAFLEEISSEVSQYIREDLVGLQEDFLNLGAMLANPESFTNKKDLEKEYLQQAVALFEREIDEMTSEMGQITQFILPGGGKVGSILHNARTVARRAERNIIALAQQEQIEQEIIMYFNRLSDFLFTLARYVNFKEGKPEKIWKKKIG